jgi:hypothetical protein
MKKKIKDSESSVIIGRDANGANITINANEFSSIVNQQLELLLMKDIRIENIDQRITDIETKINNKDDIGGFEGRIKRLEETQQEFSSFNNRAKKPKEGGKICIKRILHYIKRIVPQWCWILLLILLCSIVFIWAMLIFRDKYGFEIHNSHVSIILAFVGIAATFVVVSNYAQVKYIESKFDERVKTLNAKQRETEDFTKFLDQYTMGVADYLQALNSINNNNISQKFGFFSYKLSVMALSHFVQCTGYGGVQEHIEDCLKLMQTTINYVNNNDIDLANDSEFMSAVHDIKKTNAREFTDSLRSQFSEAEEHRIEIEKSIVK